MFDKTGLLESLGAETLVPADVLIKDNFQRIAETCGEETEIYHQALNYTQQKCRTEGIDATLKDDGNEDFDALLLFDRKGAGQQLAAQAGEKVPSCSTQHSLLSLLCSESACNLHVLHILSIKTNISHRISQPWFCTRP